MMIQWNLAKWSPMSVKYQLVAVIERGGCSKEIHNYNNYIIHVYNVWSLPLGA